MTSAPPPAPMVGPGKEEVIRQVRAHEEGRPLTISLGRYEPQAVVTHEAGRWQVRRLVKNPEKLARIQRERRAQGHYMPEHDFEALEPGPVLVEAASRAEFLDALARIPWTF